MVTAPRPFAARVLFLLLIYTHVLPAQTYFIPTKRPLKIDMPCKGEFSFQPAPNTAPPSCFQFLLRGDFLYWKPCISASEYASKISFQENNSDFCLHGKYGKFNGRWTPAFRVSASGSRSPCGLQFSIHYDRFVSTSKKTIDIELEPGLCELFNPLGQPVFSTPFGEVRGRYRLHYESGSLLIKYPYELSYCQKLSPYCGIACLYLAQKLSSQFLAALDGAAAAAVCENQTQWNSHYLAFGLKLGMDYRYPFYSSLAIDARLEGMLVSGVPTSKNTTKASIGTPVSIESYRGKDASHTLLSPGFHLAIGLLSERIAAKGITLSLRVGYEFTGWFELPSHRVFWLHEASPPESSPIGNATESCHRAIGFHGLFTGLSIAY